VAVTRPYRRTCRQFVDGQYAEGGRSGYIEHARYAQSPPHYVRALLLLLKDLQALFDYIEPADKNVPCYLFRIHALLVRACIEVEANCKAILVENGYTKSSDMNVRDYRKINTTHRLSSYEVKVPYWSGTKNLRNPFAAWASGGSLPWYQAYNRTKHDRHTEFEDATFDHLIDACCGVFVVLSSQFYTHDFTPGPGFVMLNGPNDGFDSGIGDFFRVKFPDDFPQTDRYEFDWQQLENETDPFQTIDYSAIP